MKKRLQYTYDAVGNRSLLVDPDGGRFTYAYDSLNRISHLENPQSERTTYAYDANGRRTLKRMANGTRASFTYDDASHLRRVADIKSDGTTITSFDYQYDKTGNRTAVLENGGSRVTWTYDHTYQLLSEHRTGSNGYRNTFTYDAAGVGLTGGKETPAIAGCGADSCVSCWRARRLLWTMQASRTSSAGGLLTRQCEPSCR